MLLIVAGAYNTARLYAQKVRPDPGTTKIVTEAERMRAYDPKTVKIVIVDDGGSLDQEMLDHVAILEGRGADVSWVSLDKIMGVDRVRDHL